MTTESQHTKLFILDTNVILHDSSCLMQFEENNIILPMPVIEELDRFKKGNNALNYHAREFSRMLDSLSGDKLFNGGVRIAPSLGKVSVRLEEAFHEDLKLNFSAATEDHKILNIAYWEAKRNPKRHVILVSKDVNLRIKAKAVGLTAQDYKNDQVRDPNALYSGYRTIEYVSEETISQLYGDPYAFDASLVQADPPLQANECLILRNGSKSGLGIYDAASDTVQRVDRVTASGITPRNAEQTFALKVLLDDKIELVTLTGKAGTGKTLLALAAALERRRNYRQLLLARPIVPLSNKDLGYLPGDVASKVDPYMQPLWDNMGVLKLAATPNGRTTIDRMFEDKKIEIAPLAYIRGRSLVKMFFIVDEAQNLTPHEVKTIISRAGEGTKIVLTGDIFQIDHPYLDSGSNGLSYLIERMQNQRLYAHVNLVKGERSELAELASDLL